MTVIATPSTAPATQSVDVQADLSAKHKSHTFAFRPAPQLTRYAMHARIDAPIHDGNVVVEQSNLPSPAGEPIRRTWRNAHFAYPEVDVECDGTGVGAVRGEEAVGGV